MAKLQAIALCLLINLLSCKPGTFLECYDCSASSNLGNSSSCFTEFSSVGVTQCTEPNSVCYTELKFSNNSNQPARHRGRYLDDCTSMEQSEHRCFNGGFCLVIHFEGSEKTLLCACLSGWEGHHCEMQEIDLPLDAVMTRRSPKVPRSVNEHTVRMLSNACRTREVQTTRCRYGHCFAMFLSDGTRRPFCNCRVGWTGDRCHLRVIQTNLKIVTRGCKRSDDLQVGCQAIQPPPPPATIQGGGGSGGSGGSGDGGVDTVCSNACDTNSCNSAPV